MDPGSISIPNPNNNNNNYSRQLSTSSSASSFGSIDSSTFSSNSPLPILNAPPRSKKNSICSGSNISDEIMARPRPRRRLSSVYSTESIHSGSSDVSVNEEDSNDRNSLSNNSSNNSNNNNNHTNSLNGNDKYSVFDGLRRTDSSYKGWSKEVLGIGPYGWSEEILEGGYESTDSAFSNGSDDGHKLFNTLNPFTSPNPASSHWNNASSPNTNFLAQLP